MQLLDDPDLRADPVNLELLDRSGGRTRER
jgi:hypothetical protein